jgi:hypothetical protein
LPQSSCIAEKRRCVTYGIAEIKKLRYKKRWYLASCPGSDRGAR